eukprot:evm.model.scf_886.5 EVM.evm.TU.scf_886.5   scf_886:46768-49080(+)
MGVSKPCSQQSRFLILDSQSSHSRRGTRGASRFVSMGTPSFDSSSWSGSSDTYSPRPGAAPPDAVALGLADLMSRGSTWASVNSIFTWGHDDCPPESRFIHIGGDQSSVDSDVPSSAGSPPTPVCQLSRATVELQDAINRALTVNGEQPASNLGAGILAALRDMKSSKGLAHQADMRPQGGPQKAVWSDEDGVRGCHEPVPAELLVGCQSELTTWFNNPLRSDSGEEDERGKSLGASIILPVAQQREENETLKLTDIFDGAMSVDKSLLQQLERQGGQCALQSAEVLSLLSSSLSSISSPEEVSSAPQMPEAAIDLPMTNHSGAASQESLQSASDDSEAECGTDECQADGCSYTCDCGERIAPAKEQCRGISLLFDCVDGRSHQKQQVFHDSAITLGDCTGGTATRSLVSQPFEEHGLTWGSSAASSSLCLFPDFPYLEAKKDCSTSGTAPKAGDPTPSSKEVDQESLDSNEFHDCLSDDTVEETTASPIAKPRRDSVQGGAPHTIAIPDLELGKVAFGRHGQRDAGPALSQAAKNCADPFSLTPRSLERWQQELKLIWMGEDDDDLVAEVHRGTSCNMGTARMPPLLEEDEAGWDEGTTSISPVNSPVSSPQQTCFAEDCFVEDTARTCGHVSVAEERAKADLGDVVEGGELQDGAAVDAVGRVLLELKSASPRKGGPGSEPGSRLGGMHSCARFDAPAGSGGGHRKKSVLKSVKSQLQKLTQVVTCNGPLPLSSGATGDSAGRTELEKAMLAGGQRVPRTSQERVEEG